MRPKPKPKEDKAWSAITMLVNNETGEMKQTTGISVFVPTKYSAGRHMAILMEAAEAVALDQDLTLRDHRVLRFFESRLEYANDAEGHPDAFVRLVQADVAKAMGLDRADVNRAVKKLVERKIILRMAPRGQASSYYALNANYGWRGKHREWKKRRGESPALIMLKGGKTEPEPSIATILAERGEPALFD